MKADRTQDSNLGAQVKNLSLSDSPVTTQGDIETTQCTHVIHLIKQAMGKLPSLGYDDNPWWFMARIQRLDLLVRYPWLLNSSAALYPNQQTCLAELLAKIQGKLSPAQAKQVEGYNDLPTLFDYFTRKGTAMNKSVKKPMNMLVPTRTAKERPEEFIMRYVEQYSLLLDLPTKEENPTVAKLLGWYLYDNLQRDYMHIFKGNVNNSRMFRETFLGYKTLNALQEGLLEDWSGVPAIQPNYGQKDDKNKSFNKNKQQKAQSKDQEKRPAQPEKST